MCLMRIHGNMCFSSYAVSYTHLNPFRYRATLLSFIICMVLFLSAITLMGLVQTTILMSIRTNADVTLNIYNNTCLLYTSNKHRGNKDDGHT